MFGNHAPGPRFPRRLLLRSSCGNNAIGADKVGARDLDQFHKVLTAALVDGSCEVPIQDVTSVYSKDRPTTCAGEVVRHIRKRAAW